MMVKLGQNLYLRWQKRTLLSTRHSFGQAVVVERRHEV